MTQKSHDKKESASRAGSSSFCACVPSIFHMVTHLDLYRQRHLVVAGNSVLIFICCMLVLNAPQLKLRWELEGEGITRVDRLRLWDPGNCSEFSVNVNAPTYKAIEKRSSIQTCTRLKDPPIPRIDNPNKQREWAFVNAFYCGITGASLALVCVFATVGPVITKKCPWAASAIAALTAINWATAIATIFLVNKARQAKFPSAFEPFAVPHSRISGIANKDKDHLDYYKEDVVARGEWDAHPDVGFGFSCLAVVLLFANLIMSLSTRGGIYDEGHHH